MIELAEMCSEVVWRLPTGLEPCGRKAKGRWDDAPLCGVHLRAATQRAERRNAVDRARENAVAATKALAEFQLLAQIDLDRNGYPTGGVRLTRASTDLLLEILSELKLVTAKSER